MRKILGKQFFNRPVLRVGPELLGKYLVVYGDARMITEVEAYDGEEDLACHASKGKTKRTQVMYGEAGVWYVYCIYGMYEMLNVVCDKKGYPAAILIRGVEDLSGPGKLTRELGVSGLQNGKSASTESGMWIEDRGVDVWMGEIERTPRIGVAYAGAWARKPWRFVLKKEKRKA